ncbi:MAG: DNA mismatch repair endonuclease MutL [Bdellovibrio sp.]|nr:DNA mismatch repair endonuclease MutL [Bdellovibrio sp.]
MANRIHRLPPGLAEKIAAGEVIERPASVVKELLENSLDAGATEVQVTLEEGGKNLIEILDNGSGMNAEDLALCIERHATSKLKTLEDLEKIQTLGFRGEALPSVAAVSDLSILSRGLDEELAYELRVGDGITHEQGKGQVRRVTFGHFLHSAHGTRIRASSLFATLPARLKFLKSSSAEVAAVREWMERLALAYPHVGFRLFSNERTVLDLRPQSEADRARQILSDGEDFPICSAHSEQDGMRDLGLQIRIHWLQGLSAGSSKKLVQVVNQRAIKDRLLQQAVLAPFRQLLLPGQYPAVAVLIQVNPAAIDVNVHPTKSEIRFLDSRKVFSTIHELVRKMVLEKGAPAIPRFSPSLTSQNQTAEKIPQEFFPPTKTAEPVRHEQETGKFASEETFTRTSTYESVPTERRLYWEETAQKLEASEAAPSRAPVLEKPLSEPFPREGRLIGSLFHTYFLMETGDTVLLVDQHAAHERVRYELLKKRLLQKDSNSDGIVSQTLLIPEPIRVPPESLEVLERKIPELSQLGFSVELLGSDSLIFKAVPADWGNREVKARLRNLVDRCVQDKEDQCSNSLEPSSLVDATLFEGLASQACHSSVRAGEPLEKEEMETLYQDLLKCEHPWNCPHGRPTLVKLSKSKIEEWFQRRVNSS